MARAEARVRKTKCKTGLHGRMLRCSLRQRRERPARQKTQSSRD